MRIVVSAQGETLGAEASPLFGRCPTYLFVDTETRQFEAVPNPAMNQGGGAGIQAAQFVVEHGAQAVLTGNLGPNAFDVLEAAGIPGYLAPAGTVGQVVEAFMAGRLQPLQGANVRAHAGMGGGGRGAGGSRLPRPRRRHRQRRLNRNWRNSTIHSRAYASSWPIPWNGSKNWNIPKTKARRVSHAHRRFRG